MENANTIERSSENISNKIPIMGFLLMVVGPTILIIAGFLTEVFGYLPSVIANIIAWTAIVIPGIGAIISIAMLLKWKRITKLGRGLAIVTVVMCNPFFYFLYFMVCAISSSTLAGLSWM